MPPSTCPRCKGPAEFVFIMSFVPPDLSHWRCPRCGDVPLQFAAVRVRTRLPEGTPVPPRTVRVRIAVAVRASGEWNAVGYSGADDELKAVHSLHLMGPTARVVWVEADVPLPEPAVVEGEVTP